MDEEEVRQQKKASSDNDAWQEEENWQEDAVYQKKKMVRLVHHQEQERHQGNIRTFHLRLQEERGDYIFFKNKYFCITDKYLQLYNYTFFSENNMGRSDAFVFHSFTLILVFCQKVTDGVRSF